MAKPTHWFKRQGPHSHKVCLMPHESERQLCQEEIRHFLHSGSGALNKVISEFKDLKCWYRNHKDLCIDILNLWNLCMRWLVYWSQECIFTHSLTFPTHKNTKILRIPSLCIWTTSSPMHLYQMCLTLSHCFLSAHLQALWMVINLEKLILLKVNCVHRAALGSLSSIRIATEEDTISE